MYFVTGPNLYRYNGKGVLFYCGMFPTVTGDHKMKRFRNMTKFNQVICREKFSFCSLSSGTDLNDLKS